MSCHEGNHYPQSISLNIDGEWRPDCFQWCGQCGAYKGRGDWSLPKQAIGGHKEPASAPIDDNDIQSLLILMGNLRGRMQAFEEKLFHTEKLAFHALESSDLAHATIKSRYKRRKL